MLIPEVIGFEQMENLLKVLQLRLVLTDVKKKGAVEKFVEFYGEGLKIFHLQIEQQW